MNYDKAHELVKSIRETDEYKRLMKSQEALVNDEEAKKLVKEFISEQAQMQYAEMSGEKDLSSYEEKLKKVAEKVNETPLAKEYLQAHMIYQKGCEDIYRIVMEVITEGMKVLEK